MEILMKQIYNLHLFRMTYGRSNEFCIHFRSLNFTKNNLEFKKNSAAYPLFLISFKTRIVNRTCDGNEKIYIFQMYRFTSTAHKHTHTHTVISWANARPTKYSTFYWAKNANRSEWNEFNEWMVFATKNACMHLTYNTKPRRASISINWIFRNSCASHIQLSAAFS